MRIFGFPKTMLGFSSQFDASTGWYLGIALPRLVGDSVCSGDVDIATFAPILPKGHMVGSHVVEGYCRQCPKGLPRYVLLLSSHVGVLSTLQLEYAQ